MFNKEIIKPATAAEMVNAYNEGVKEMREAYQQLAYTEKRLKAAFGNYTGYSSLDVVIRDAYGWDKDNPARLIEKIEGNLKRAAWQRIVERLEIKKLMSTKRADELDKMLDNGNLPEVTEEEIFALIAKFVEDAPDIQKELVDEVFKLLRPSPRWRENYKTNDEFKVGKKVILSWMVERQWTGGKFRLTGYHRNYEINALDRVFHLLDGKMIEEGYNSPLAQAIETAPGGVGETDYFKFKCYKNKNLHLEFKRMDLVKKLNEIGGGNGLPGNATQKTMF